MNPFKYSFDNKRYHTLNYHYQTLFNQKVFKVSLNAAFSCPNINQKTKTGGCIYCSKYENTIEEDLLSQFNRVKKIMLKKWPHSKYIGYFQANSNTYAPLKTLKEKYELILKQDNVIGLNIATRADCIKDDVLDYLSELNQKTFLTIELGLQTIHHQTSILINRGHDLTCFEKMIKKLRSRNINVVVHIINGLPYETKEMMLETVKYLSQLDIQGIKIHMLHILRNTALENMYKEKKFPLLSLKKYVAIVCDQLELLPQKIVIHRITGDPIIEDLIEPFWLTKKFIVLNEIDKELQKRNSYQGIRVSI